LPNSQIISTAGYFFSSLNYSSENIKPEAQFENKDSRIESNIDKVDVNVQCKNHKVLIANEIMRKECFTAIFYPWSNRASVCD